MTVESIEALVALVESADAAIGRLILRDANGHPPLVVVVVRGIPETTAVIAAIDAIEARMEMEERERLREMAGGQAESEAPR